MYIFAHTCAQTIPLELNTVRFIDNFSAGTRGAASAELVRVLITCVTRGRELLACGYAVVFLHRHRSMQPFMRRAPGPLFDYLALDMHGRAAGSMHTCQCMHQSPPQSRPCTPTRSALHWRRSTRCGPRCDDLLM